MRWRGRRFSSARMCRVLRRPVFPAARPIIKETDLNTIRTPLQAGARRWRSVWAKCLAVLTLLLTAGLSHADPSPPGANNWSCQPSAAHPRPVVLVHGTFSNMAENWAVLAPRLANAGYCVFALNYGANQYTPLTGNQVYAIGPIEQSAQQLAAFVQQVLAATGAAQVDIVGHSQGGMMPRYYLEFLGGRPFVHSLIGIAPDNDGTTLDGINTLAQAFPAVTYAVAGSWCQACSEQLQGSSFITNLNANYAAATGVIYTVISTKDDEVATPYTSQFLSGPNTTNIVVQNQCPLDTSDHVMMAVDPIVGHNVLNALDPATATTPTCAG
jgi:triacylglycerol esterase/lipase EstA (alpha/beta hydrolase family)